MRFLLGSFLALGLFAMLPIQSDAACCGGAGRGLFRGGCGPVARVLDRVRARRGNVTVTRTYSRTVTPPAKTMPKAK